MKIKMDLRVLGNKIKYNLPTILAVGAGIGTIATATLSALATKKSIEKIDKLKERENHVQPKEIITDIVPLYFPTVLSCGITIGCIVESTKLNNSQKATLMSSLGSVAVGLDHYRSKIIESQGVEVDKKACAESTKDFVAIDKYNATPRKNEKLVWHINVDDPDLKPFKLYERDVISAEYYFNRHYVLEGYASLNDFYDFLGRPRTKYGDRVGWSIDTGTYWIECINAEYDDDEYPNNRYINISDEPQESYLVGWEDYPVNEVINNENN